MLRSALLRRGQRAIATAAAVALGAGAAGVHAACRAAPDTSLSQVEFVERKQEEWVEVAQRKLADSFVDWLDPDPAYVEALRTLRSAYQMPLATLETMKAYFLSEARAGLAGTPGASLRMLPTYVTNRVTGNETGNFYALDLGGTNFRVLKLSLLGGGKVGPVTQGKYKVPDSAKQGSADELFGFLADSVAHFLATQCGGNPSGVMGFTFSFPTEQVRAPAHAQPGPPMPSGRAAEHAAALPPFPPRRLPSKPATGQRRDGQHLSAPRGAAARAGGDKPCPHLGSAAHFGPVGASRLPIAPAHACAPHCAAHVSHLRTVQDRLNRGRLIVWNKEFSAAGVVGEDVVAMLQEQLIARGIQLEVRALANDTVGTMEAAAYAYPDTTMGVILGTGTNAAYIEQTKNVTKWQGEPSEEMVINTEWGNLDMEQIMTVYDAAIDVASQNPGLQRYEQRGSTSGLDGGEWALVDP